MRFWFAAITAITALFCAPLAAREAPLRSSCHASGTAGEPIAAIVADPARWRCGAGEPSLANATTLLRFDLGKGAEARYFSTRPSLFAGLTLAAVRDGRVVVERRYPANAVSPGTHGRILLLPLPPHARGDTIVVAFDRPTTRGLFGDARVFASDPTLSHEAMHNLLLAAIVCGMLIMPLAFNAAYFRVLRERFVLWHMALSVALLTQCLLTSGIVGHFVSLSLPVHARLVIVSFGLAVAAAAAFCAAVIEPRRLDPRLRQGLYVVAAQVVITTLLHATFPHVLRSVQSPVYYASFVPVLSLFTLVIIDAWRRGSRAVRYQLVGWSLFMVMGVIRIVTMFTPGIDQNEAISLFYAAMVVESIATSLGVADRFMNIRRQRDRALARARSLEHLSERDDLTGLYNRRALDGLLGDFAHQRFTGFALFDLDNFKRVNDTQGHATGDAVLRVVAAVLDGHEDGIALRMGGEEFLLLLRGDNVAERVERLREAIPVRIAREVAELETLVTSSAGLVTAAPGGDIGNDFIALYRTADDLLYEAKHNGRNLLAAVTLEPAVPTTTPTVAAA